MLSPKANAVVKVWRTEDEKNQLDHVPYAPMTIDSIHLAPYLNTHHVWRKATQTIIAERTSAGISDSPMGEENHPQNATPVSTLEAMYFRPLYGSCLGSAKGFAGRGTLAA
jgi:hypothetical protein